MTTRNSDLQARPDLTQLADVINKQGEAFEAFTDRQGETQHDLKSRLERLELSADAPPFSGRDSLPDYDVKAFESFLRTGDRSHLDTKAMSIGTDGAGGYTHIRELGNAIIAATGELNPLMREVRQVQIEANEYRQIFTTSRNASARSAEGGTRNESNTATFEVSDVLLYDLYAYPKVTNELLNSSQFNLDAWIRADISEAFSEALGTEFVTGDGSSKSVGLLNSTSTLTIDGSPVLPWGSIHSVSRSPGGVEYGNLLDCISALPLRYRAAGNAKWYMSTTAIEAARNLKDSQNMPIWRQDFGIAGAPMVLLGYPVIEVPQMDGQGHTVLFGDMMQAYAFVRHERGLGIIVDQITSPGHTKFYASLQCAGGVMDSRAVVALAG